MGLSNGFTLLIRGEILRDRGQRYTTLPPPAFKPRGAQGGGLVPGSLVPSSATVGGTSASTSHAAFGGSGGGQEVRYAPVTGIGFCERREHSASKTGAVSSRRSVWLWVAAGPGDGGGLRAFNTETAARSV